MTNHNRQKHYKIDQSAKFLEELGLANNGAIKPNKYKKYRQICRFAEIFVERIEKTNAIKQNRVKVLDVGSGKGYLTFAIYDVLQNLNLNPKVDGVDIKTEVINFCNQVAGKCNFENLSFTHKRADDVEQSYYDAIVALHACDTATDDAIYYGIRSKSKIIVSAPCCQKEIFSQIKANKRNAFISDGLFVHKFADLCTDNSRVMLLRSQGYNVDVIDFVASEHTQKNTLIIATKKGGKKEKFWTDYQSYKKEFGFKEGIKLEHLLVEGGYGF